MPNLISFGKAACLLLIAIASVFAILQIDYPIASSAVTLNADLHQSMGLALKICQTQFSPDSKSLAVLAGDRFVSNWPVAGGKPTASVLFASIPVIPISCIEWDPTGNQLYLGTSKSQILSCNPATLEIQLSINSDILIIEQMQSVSGSESLLSLGNIFNPKSNYPETFPQLWHNAIHSRPQNIPNLPYILMSKQVETGLIVLGAYTGEIVVFNPLLNTVEGKVIAKINSPMDALIWSGNTLIATSKGALHLIDISESQSIKTMQISDKLIRLIRISNDEKTLFLSDGGDVVQVRDKNSGDLIYKLASLDEMVNSIVLSPDGKTLAVGTTQGHVTLWDAHDFQIKAIIPAGIK
jgi:WD40 repeat protein